MTRREYQAGIPTTLAASITSSDTSFTINDYTNWPDGADYDFWVTIDGGTAQEERVLCTSRSTGIVTVATGGRGSDGTTASAHAQGATIWPSWSATDADEANAHINSSSGVHGISGAVVGTTDEQILTYKRLNSPKINEDVVLTATATELNILDGATLSTAELNYVDGVTSSIQTQLNTKAPSANPTFTGTVVLPSATSIGNVSSTELGYIDGVTSAIQTQINNLIPKGLIAPCANSSAPDGWLLCYGQAVSKTTYADLYTAIGTNAFGTDTSTDFYLPDLRGRVIAALDNMGGTDAGRLDWANTRGTTGGSQTQTLTEANLPAHDHSVSFTRRLTTADTHDHEGFTAGDFAAPPDDRSGETESTATVSKNTGPAGSGTAHNNMQPTILLNYIIKY